MTRGSANNHTLSNGLRLTHRFDGDSTQVAVAVLYAAGARDEKPDKTGLAHLLEHLMFTGSARAPRFDEEMEAAGGLNNAWTSDDFTCYHEVVPAMNVETALWLESDRMTALNFDPQAFEVQRKVVVEEFYQQCINNPYGTLLHAVRSLAYERHPYSCPVIGRTPQEVEALTLDDARDFYNSFYSPTNAVLAIAGNITFGKAKELAEKWFGNIPGRDVPRRDYRKEEPLATNKTEVLPDNVSSILISLNFPMDGYGTEGYYAADLLTDILSSGRSSVFYRKLVDGTQLFDSVDASIHGTEDPGLLSVSAMLRENVDAEEALRKVDEVLFEFASKPVDRSRLERTLTRMESTKVFDNLGLQQRVQDMAVARYHNEPDGVNMEPYRRLTPQRIQEEARRLFVDSKRVAVTIIPNNKKDT